jgi:hypothetical protein
VPPTTLYRLAGLAGTVGVEYVTNSVFPHLDDAVVESLVDGPTGTTLLLAATGTLAPPPWTRVGA